MEHLSVSSVYKEFQTEDGKLMFPPDLIVPNPTQPREFFDPADLDRLAENVKKFGMEKPIVLMPLPKPQGAALFMIVDGEFRWRACKRAGCLVWAVVGQAIGDPEELFEKSLNANYPQAPHTTHEVIKAIRRLEARKRTVEQMALIFGKSVAWIGVHKRVAKLHPKVLDLLRPQLPEDQRLPLMHASDLADLPQEQQIGLAEMVVAAGLSRAHLKNLIRMALAERGAPARSRTRPDKEFQGVISLFRRTHDRVAILVSQKSEVARIVRGRRPDEVRVLIEHMRQSRKDIELLLEAFQEHAK